MTSAVDSTSPLLQHPTTHDDETIMDSKAPNSRSLKGSVPKRRVTQACSTCRGRKTRCDAGLPRCSLCVDLGVECVYLDPQNSKIDPSTRILLERIQRLEDRLFSTPILQPSRPRNVTSNTAPTPTSPLPVLNDHTEQPPVAISPGRVSEAENSFFTLPATHDANSDHVYRSPIVQEIIDRSLRDPEYSNNFSAAPPKLHDATDIFLLSKNSGSRTSNLPIESWRLFSDPGRLRDFRQDGQPGNSDEFNSLISIYEDLISHFFINVNAFYALIHGNHINEYLRAVTIAETEQSNHDQNPLSISQYCLLLIVLCLGFLSKTGHTMLPAQALDSYSSANSNSSIEHHSTEGNRGIAENNMEFEFKMWQKVQLLLGHIASEDSVDAALCFALTSINLGANGRAFEAHSYINTAKSLRKEAATDPEFSDQFRRLFWVVYVIESDFASEFSTILPSRITIFEDFVPYPSASQCDESMEDSSPTTPTSTTISNSSFQNDFTAFQISTNSAIRRFINRITAVMYNPKEAWRKENPVKYATWLHKMADELRSHHEAIYENLPPFLVTRNANDLPQHMALDQNTASGVADNTRFLNHLWNVARVRGRYYAGLYIINRPLFEYVLVNSTQLDQHPVKDAIFESCKACLLGCSGFVKVMFEAQANTLASLFATGMATFTMVIILMIATDSPVFQNILPEDIETVILMGRQNMRRYSASVKEFEWHIRELEKIDKGRKIKS